MATKWEKVKYIRRVRPDSDDGLTDECYDAIDDSKVNITLNGEQSALTSQEGIKPKFYQENPLLSQSQPILKHRSNSCLYLSVPQNIGRQKTHEEARGTSSLRKTSSTFSLVNNHEIDGDISTRSQPSKNTPRILVRDLFNSKPEYKSHRLKVSLNIIYINKLALCRKIAVFHISVFYNICKFPNCDKSTWYCIKWSWYSWASSWKKIEFRKYWVTNKHWETNKRARRLICISICYWSWWKKYHSLLPTVWILIDHRQIAKRYWLISH